MYGFTLGRDPKAAPRVLAVRPDSPAARAGLKPGDRLQSINGYELSNAQMPFRAGGSLPAARQPLHIVRGQSEAVDYDPGRRRRPSAACRCIRRRSTASSKAWLLCLLLLVFDRFRRRDGELFALMMSIYPVTRFLIEGLRTDEGPVLGTGMSISQNVSLLMLICAAALWFYSFASRNIWRLQSRPAKCHLGKPSSGKPCRKAK